MAKIWSDAGCTTTNRYIAESSWAKTQTKDALIDDAKLWATTQDTIHEQGCYIPTVPTRTYSSMPFIDYAGQGDIKTVSGNTSSCKAECDITPSCNAFTSNGSQCWLKQLLQTDEHIPNASSSMYYYYNTTSYPPATVPGSTCLMNCADEVSKTQQYYNTKSEYKGLYTMQNPVATTVHPKLNLCDVSYTYVPVGSGTSGTDTRRFTFQPTGDPNPCMREVTAMNRLTL
jgi:hypothetical protein